MAVEKVGVYRKWLGPVPNGKNGKPIPESEWPRKRRHHWIARWYGTNGKRYGKVFLVWEVKLMLFLVKISIILN